MASKAVEYERCVDEPLLGVQYRVGVIGQRAEEAAPTSTGAETAGERAEDHREEKAVAEAPEQPAPLWLWLLLDGVQI